MPGAAAQPPRLAGTPQPSPRSPLPSLVRLRSRQVSDSREYWAKSMASTFMICADASSGQLVEYVVDVHFKELFRIAYASHAYK